MDSLGGTYTLGGDRTVPRLDFGAMRLTGQPGNFGPYRDPAAGARLLREAYELGFRFFDTARTYGPGHNEELIARALHPYPQDLLIATKIGVEKPAPGVVHPDGRPAAIRRGIDESLTRLRRDRLDLVYLHQPDPAVPIEDSVGALAELQQGGLIAHIGVSNVSNDQLARARSITRITAVQNRYNLTSRGDDELLDGLAAAGVAYVPHGPPGAHPAGAAAPLAQHPALTAIADRHQATAGQLALAWLLHRAPNIVPVPGTTTHTHLRDNAAATLITLAPADLRALDRLVLPAERFATLVGQFTGASGVTVPDESGRGRFGSRALKVNGAIFAMLSRDRLVVKLPRDRVDVLITGGAGRPFDAGKGRPMKEWLTIAADDDQTWQTLAEEAMHYVATQ